MYYDDFNLFLLYFCSAQVYKWDKFKSGFDMLTNHAGYRRPEMLSVVPNATLIATIRDPVRHFESAFCYYGYADQLGLKNKTHPIGTFLRDYDNLANKLHYGSAMRHSGQLKYLGLSEDKLDDSKAVDSKIQQLSNELDLVIITEYLDESLVLLRRLLCWTFDELTYVSKNIRSSSYQYNLTKSEQDLIRQRNKADVKLYNHFNKTLWTKIKKYGKSAFERDLKEFRYHQEKLNRRCVSDEIDGNSRLTHIVAKESAKEKCWDSLIASYRFVELKKERLHNLTLSRKKRQFS